MVLKYQKENVVKIHTGKLWVFQETLSLGSNTLINFFIIFQETLLFGRHFHSELQSSIVTILFNLHLDLERLIFSIYALNIMFKVVKRGDGSLSSNQNAGAEHSDKIDGRYFPELQILF